MLRSIDPATGRELAKFPEADEAAIEAAIARAWEVRHGWRDAGIERRSQMIRAVAGVLRADKARYASILTAEMGKPIVEAEGEVAKCAETAGKVLKKSVLELGGSDPFVVLDDADVTLAATVACRARNQNNGQSCIAAKRFIVVEDVADEFEKKFVSAVGALKVGDPTDRGNQVGPLARPDLLDALERQVRESVGMGARVLVGGKRLDGDGNYFEPTVIGGVTREMPVFKEETFGPVAALIRVKNEEEALAVANDSDFGLGSCVWTADVARGERFAERVEAGLVFINAMVASDARLPFGGVKRSGYGRELGSIGIREFTNIQTVWVGPAKT